MKYYGGCDVGSTYTKAVILDETGKICADTTIRSKINSETSAKLAMEEVLNKVGLKSSQDLAYLIGTGYGRNRRPGRQGHLHRHRRHREKFRHERQVRRRYRPLLRGHGPQL